MRSKRQNVIRDHLDMIAVQSAMLDLDDKMDQILLERLYLEPHAVWLKAAKKPKVTKLIKAFDQSTKSFWKIHPQDFVLQSLQEFFTYAVKKHNVPNQAKTAQENMKRWKTNFVIALELQNQTIPDQVIIDQAMEALEEVVQDEPTQRNLE